MSDYTFPAIGIPTGWQCPVCKRVYSPGTTMCLFCGGQITTVNDRTYTGTEVFYITQHSQTTTSTED